MPCAGHDVSDAVRVSSLVKLYGEVRAVDGIDFRVGTGQVFSFLGPNGAGKTTTVEILEGLRPRSSGDVEVLGLDPWKDVDRIHRKIVMIPQDFKFFEKVTAKEAVDLWANLFGVKADATELLRRVELSDKAGAYYETLSGGQKQKLGLALALVNDPEICFLDEPTTGLDPRARRSIWEVIRGLKSEGRTVFLTTHYLEEAQLLADEIAIINHGKIIVSGTPDALIRKVRGGGTTSARGVPEAGGLASRAPAVAGRGHERRDRDPPATQGGRAQDPDPGRVERDPVGELLDEAGHPGGRLPPTRGPDG